MPHAAKHFDLVLGLDAHVMLVTTPTGPVPMTVPTPFTGFVFDWKDYLPWVGSTVWINGRPSAQVGTPVMAFPAHVPYLGPFLKQPGNEGEVYEGSSKVACQGEPLSFSFAHVATCQDIGVQFGKVHSTTTMPLLPTSVLLVFPCDRPVLVGGEPVTTLSALYARMKNAARDHVLTELRPIVVPKRWEAALVQVNKRLHGRVDRALTKGPSWLRRTMGNDVRRWIDVITFK